MTNPNNILREKLRKEIAVKKTTGRPIEPAQKLKLEIQRREEALKARKEQIKKKAIIEKRNLILNEIERAQQAIKRNERIWQERRERIGSRGRKIIDNRIKGYQTKIKFLESNLKFITPDVDINKVIKKSTEIRRKLTKQLERQRIKREGLTPTKIIQPTVKKVPEKLIRTKLRLGNKIITGVVDKKNKFIPDIGESKSLFKKLAKTQEGKLISDYKQLKRREEKEQELKKKIDEIKKAKTLQEKKIDKFLKDLGLDFAGVEFDLETKKKIIKKLDEGIKFKLDEIDKNPRYDSLQKETKKRQLLGIRPGAGSIQELIEKEITDRELKEALNEITGPSPQNKNFIEKSIDTLTGKPKRYFQNKFQLAQQKGAKGDLNAGALWGVLTFGTGLINTLSLDAYNIVAMFGNAEETVKGINKARKNPNTMLLLKSDFRKLQEDLKKGDPLAWAEGVSYFVNSGIAKLGLKTFSSTAKTLNKGIKVMDKLIFAPDQLKKLDKQISILKSAKGLTREEKRLLKLLEEQKKIQRELKFITGATNNIRSDITKIAKSNTKIPTQNINSITIKNKKVNTRIRNITKKVKALPKISDKRKGELLNKFLTARKVEVKILKVLPKTEEGILAQLLKARKVSGEAFSRLKKKIKKERGLNVVQRTNKDGTITFKLLEPKQQRKKGIVTARKKEFEFVVGKDGKTITKIEIRNKPNFIDIDLMEKKITKPQLDKLEKQIGKEIQSIKKGKNVLYGKKAQASLFQGFRKTSKSIRQQTQTLNKDFQNYINDYRKSLAKTQKSKDFPKGKKARFSDLPKSEQLKFKKKASILKKQVDSIIKLNMKLAKILSLSLILSKLIGLVSTQLKYLSSAQTQVLQSINIIKNITTKIIRSIVPTKPRKPIKPQPTIKKISKVIKKPIIKKLTPLQLKQLKLKKLREAKLKKLKLDLDLDFSFDSIKLSNRVVLYEGMYRERRNPNKNFHPRTNPVITKTLNKLTTRNRALKFFADLADKKAIRSIQVKAKKLTPKKVLDIKSPAVLKKFRPKKTKGTPVLKLVEKTKHIADTKTEVRELKALRKKKFIKKKKVIKKIVKKKKINKTKSTKRVSKVSKPSNKKKSSKKASIKRKTAKVIKKKKTTRKNKKK